jgi:hypothetical protein
MFILEEIANQLNTNLGKELISLPSGIMLTSDHLAFFQFGLPVMVFYATQPLDSPDFALGDLIFDGDVFHTEQDSLDSLMENHPGRVERALNQFGRFLEEVVSSEFVQ